MKERRRGPKPTAGITLGVILLVAFAAFTFLVKVYDVQAIGVNGTDVGFSTVNSWFQGEFPWDEGCYSISEYLGYICLFIAALNTLIFIIDLCRRKGDFSRRYFITVIFYVIVMALYVAFEFVVINYRPTELEASYPSSHTLLGMFVLYSEIVLLRYGSRENEFWAIIFRLFCWILMISMVGMRLLSGVHWLTDIAGSVRLSFSLMLIYGSLVSYFDPSDF